MYTENELVGVAKRWNNNKRKYLVVNKRQGKHVPASPEKILGMFQDLALNLKDRYAGDRLLIIGFAETATAIGAAVAANFDCYYIQTTREEMEGVEYLYFTEAHSHAAEQKLVKNDIEQVISSIDKIIFIEDEVTTGNTIMNIINIIEKEYNSDVSFCVASLLNGMDKESEENYRNKGIALHYLVKTNHAPYDLVVDKYRGDGACYGPFLPKNVQDYRCVNVQGYINARRVTKGDIYHAACRKLWENIYSKFVLESGSEVLILGTEEFMYPALFAAGELQKMGCKVKFHATTRSPIVVSREKDYPLHSRYELKSLYNKNRDTYIYDLSNYHSVFIITDAGLEERLGLESLIAALEAAGNDTITIIRWC